MNAAELMTAAGIEAEVINHRLPVFAGQGADKQDA
jgi:hypothetical protein